MKTKNKIFTIAVDKSAWKPLSTTIRFPLVFDSVNIQKSEVIFNTTCEEITGYCVFLSIVLDPRAITKDIETNTQIIKNLHKEKKLCLKSITDLLEMGVLVPETEEDCYKER